eukprot:2127910-Pleurochrysis_carterae.AAC.1
MMMLADEDGGGGDGMPADENQFPQRVLLPTRTWRRQHNMHWPTLACGRSRTQSRSHAVTQSRSHAVT